MLPKTNTYVKSYYDKAKWMSFLIEGEELLKKYNYIWKVRNCIKKEFDNTPINNKKFLKTLLKS